MRVNPLILGRQHEEEVFCDLLRVSLLLLERRKTWMKQPPKVKFCTPLGNCKLSMKRPTEDKLCEPP